MNQLWQEQDERAWADDGLEQQYQMAQEIVQEQYLAAGSPLYQDEDTTMKVGDMIESKYLKQSDVQDETAVTVAALKKVNVARDDEDPDYKWTIKFNEFAKPMVLNVTNLKRMAKALGDDTDDWLGNQVILFVDPDIEFGGNVVGGLRIKGMRKQVAGAKPKTVDDVNDELNDIPF
jgi:hypothetical protein